MKRHFNIWNNANERFLIGHEYSHALLKHSNGESNLLSDTVFLQSWFNEVEADSISQEILFKIVAEKLEDKYFLGWNKYSLYGGLFFLNTLKIFENGQSILDDNKEIPSLSEKNFNTIIDILKNKADLSGNLQKFKSLNPSVWMDHPPTEIRIALIQKLVNKQEKLIKHEREDYNLAEDFHADLAQK